MSNIGMRKVVRPPRDLDKYQPISETAKWLRSMADALEKKERPSTVVKVRLDVSYWDPKWLEENK